MIGLVALWPRGSAPDLGSIPRDYVDGTIVDTEAATCTDIEVPEATTDCTTYRVQLDGGT